MIVVCSLAASITFIEATVNSLLSDSNDADRVVGVNANLKALDGATGDAQKQEVCLLETVPD